MSAWFIVYMFVITVEYRGMAIRVPAIGAYTPADDPGLLVFIAVVSAAGGPRSPACRSCA